jgi:nitrous oxide reductase accessory protein NosL
MKKFSFLFLIFIGAFFIACDSKVDMTAKEVKFDREVCERCKMIISDRNYAVQIVNKADGKRYYFDDIGCTVNWFKEGSISWANDAIIYVTDAKTGKWIDARKAFWTYGAVTPMNFGFSAFETKQDNKENYDYAYVNQKLLEQIR